MITNLLNAFCSLSLSALLLLNSLNDYGLMQFIIEQFNTYHLSQIEVKTESQVSKKSAENQKSWYEASNLLSLGALIVSIIAFLSSQTISTTQEIREKKEELRQIIEKLIEFRENLDSKISQIQDEQARLYAATLLNAKRIIYLEAAELITNKIPNNVVSSEYLILAEENYSNADFVQAREYYKKAVNAAKRSSSVIQVAALRSLAGNYFVSGKIKDIEKGRKYFKEAVYILENQKDSYSIYQNGLTYRYWAYHEILWGDESQAIYKLERAKALFINLPYEMIFYRESELKLTASIYQILAVKYFSKESESDIVEGRKFFNEALSVISNLTNANSISLIKGQIYQAWGEQENLQRHKDGESLLKCAKQEYLKLPDKYPLKDESLVRIEQMINKIA